MTTVPTNQSTRQQILGVVWVVIAIVVFIPMIFELIDYPFALQTAQPDELSSNVLVEFNSETQTQSIIDASPLAIDFGFQIGDEIIAVNGKDYIPYFPRVRIGDDFVFTVQQPDEPTRDYAFTSTTPRHPVTLALWELGVDVDVTTVGVMLFEVIRFALFMGVAGLIVWKRRKDWVAQFVVIALIMSLPIRHEETLLRTTFEFNYLSGVCAQTIVLIAMFIFPDGRFNSRLPIALVAIYFLYGSLVALSDAFIITPPVDLSSQGVRVLEFSINVLIWVALYMKYRQLRNVVQQQQFKWAILGFLITALSDIMPSVVGLIFDVYPDVGHLAFLIPYAIARTMELAFPMGLALAILRYRLWDVDVIINRSMVYGVVTILAIGLFFSISAGAQVAFGNTQPVFALIISGVLSVGFYRPVCSNTQHFVDRYIFNLRFDMNELKPAPVTITNPGKLTGLKFGDYEVGNVLGKGGMGEVYEGYGRGQHVAIKTMLPDFANQGEYRIRFEREAEAGKTLQHEHIAKVFDSGEHEGIPYLIMEYIDGQDLGDMLVAKGRLDEKTAIALLQDVCKALEMAHETGYIHRDLKPSNIMIRQDGSAVLMDFGISKVQNAHTLTGSGAIGTVQYMAPEQIMAAKEVDHRADIYALGAVLYQMLVGETPFSGSVGQMVFAHIKQPPPNPRDKNEAISDDLADVILKALEKDPSNRFESAMSFANALQN